MKLISQDGALTQWLVILASSLLLVIWPLPGTIALRHLLLAAGAATSVYLIVAYKRKLNLKLLRPLLPIVCFFAWILIHFLIFFSDRQAQLGELTGFWLRSLLSALVGVGFAVVASQAGHGKDTRLTHESALLLGLSGTLTIYLLRYAYEVAITGMWLHRDFYMTPFQGKPQIVVFVMIFIAALYARLASRKTTGEKRIWLFATTGVVVLALFVFYTANTKNGFLIFLILSTFFLLSSLLKARFNKNLIVISIIIAPIVFFTYKHISTETAWRNMIADIKIGVDIDNQNYWKNWKDSPTPINELGNHANQSTYLRTAWATAAIQLIRENPLGYGLMSYSFTYLAQQKWRDFDTKSGLYNVATHSGWIDLTLAFGYPAIVLLLFSLGRSFFLAFGRKDFLNAFSLWGSICLTTMYLTVEVSFDIFFELLFFLAAFFSVITANTRHPR